MASQYPVNIVTRNGLALISESIATKKNLLFTRIVAGDGTLSDNTDISTMTDVLSPKLELNSTTGVNEGNGQYKIYATISNSKLDVGFFPREVGLYAKVEGGQEVLYSYTNGGNNVGYIPDKTTPIDSEIYKITTVIGNAKNVSLVLKDETFATLLDLNLHNTATDAHANLFNQFLPLAGGTMAGDLNVLNKALTDNSRSAASTKFVRDLLNSYMTKGQVNFSNFKTAMAGAVEYDYSNPNAWWRKEPDGLIIQGINVSINYAEMEVKYPISINKYLGSLILSHDYFDAQSAKSIERLTKFSNGRMPNELSQIGFRKVNVKDSTPYVDGGASIIIFGF